MAHEKVIRREKKKHPALLSNLTLMGKKAKVRRGKRNVNISFIFELVVFNLCAELQGQTDISSCTALRLLSPAHLHPVLWKASYITGGGPVVGGWECRNLAVLVPRQALLSMFVSPQPMLGTPPCPPEITRMRKISIKARHSLRYNYALL